MRINCGQSLSVGSKCVKNSPCGSVRLVPTNIAFTPGFSLRYASSPGCMGNAYRDKSRWYWVAEVVTKVSTSGNGCLEIMYTACRRREVVNGGCELQEVCKGFAVFGFLGADIVSEEAAGFGSEEKAHTGKQAKISTNMTTQSFPPLYDIESCSGLPFCTLC